MHRFSRLPQHERGRVELVLLESDAALRDWPPHLFMRSNSVSGPTCIQSIPYTTTVTGRVLSLNSLAAHSPSAWFCKPFETLVGDVVKDRLPLENPMDLNSLAFETPLAPSS